MPPRLHLIDGTYELFRAFYSKRPGHQTPDGQDAKGALGVTLSLLALLRDEREAVSHIAVAFDNPIECFRNDLFNGYKTGDGIDPDLASQFELVEDAVRSLGIVVWSMDRWEADDALATAAARWKRDVEQVRIMTPDKDLGQMIDDRRVVQVDRRQEKEIDEAALRARRGVGPKSIPDLLALTGDAADGIPGIPGFGEKSAAKLLAEYEHIERIPDDPSEWKVAVRGAARLAETLAGRREDALLYKKLATLVTDVPLSEELEDLEWRGVPKKALETFAAKIGDPKLPTRPHRWA